MEIFDNLAKGVKDFFVENDGDAPAQASPSASAAPTAFMAPAAGAAPVVTQAEQRHLDHIAGLLAGNGKDFQTYLKMVKSMAAAGMSGALLYQTAFNAFSAVSGVAAPELLASAGQFEEALAADREKVLARHREKMGEAVGAGAPSAVVQLSEREKKLAADLADLSQQIQTKQQQLVETQQQLTAERQKTQAALASYELAQSAALTELQAHHKAAESFLLAAK